MSGTSTPLPLLGLAEELSTLEAPLGDRSLELLVRHLLDRQADAIVDLTQGRSTLSRPDLPAPPHAVAGEQPLDRVACSAVAARCRRAATTVEHWGQGAPVDSRPLADRVVISLDLLAAGLQRLAQDVVDEAPATARQRLQRTVRRAVTALDAPAI